MAATAQAERTVFHVTETRADIGGIRPGRVVRRYATSVTVVDALERAAAHAIPPDGGQIVPKPYGALVDVGWFEAHDAWKDRGGWVAALGAGVRLRPAAVLVRALDGELVAAVVAEGPFAGRACEACRSWHRQPLDAEAAAAWAALMAYNDLLNGELRRNGGSANGGPGE